MTEIPQGNNLEAHEVEGKNFNDLTKATTLLLSDAPDEPVDAVYFFGRSFFDAGKRDLFKVASDLIKNNKAKYIIMADSEGERVGESVPRAASPGKSLWTDRLVKLGVDPERILYAPHLDPQEKGFHTKSEADAFVKLSQEKGLKSAVVITQPHQIVRAMLGVVKALDQQSLDIDTWCMLPPATDWGKKVRGSQGMELKPRTDHIQDEIDRIFRYQEKGDIASFDELFSYLEKRDNRAAENPS